MKTNPGPFKRGDPIWADWLQWMLDRILMLCNITATPPIRAALTPGGVAISLAADYVVRTGTVVKINTTHNCLIVQVDNPGFDTDGIPTYLPQRDVPDDPPGANDPVFVEVYVDGAEPTLLRHLFSPGDVIKYWTRDGNGKYLTCYEDRLRTAKVATCTSTSSAPPLVYTVKVGHWSAITDASPGTWVDDSGGVAIKAYQENASNSPCLVDSYVTVRLRGYSTDDPAKLYFSIVGGTGVFEVFLTSSSGGAGDATTAADWKYAVFLDSGRTVQVGNDISPVFRRPIGKVDKAVTGIASISDTAVNLLCVDEIPSRKKREC